MTVPYTVKSYLYLRIAMIAVISMLAASVVIEWWRTDFRCWQESVSSYYYTPVQAVFVGGLITIGVCMVALKGTTEWEDILMNLGGMLAPVVALVPTPGPGTCRSVPLTVSDAPANIHNNIIAFFVAGVIAIVVTVSTRRGRTVSDRPGQTRMQTFGIATAIAICLGGILWFALGRASFDHNAHYTAAIMLFGCIVGVVILNSRRRAKELPGAQRWSPRYMWIAVAMVGLGVGLVAVTLATGWSHGILVVEAVLIVLFGVFWVIQTNELWDSDRSG